LNDPRSPEEPRPRIPTVGDLAEEVARSRVIPPERRSELFHAARQVCAEELRMVRTGFAPAPLDDLAARVVRLLPAEMGGERYPGWSWDQDAPFPDEPMDDSVPAFSPDDPFGGVFETAPAETPAARVAAEPEIELAEREEDEEEEEEEPEVAFAVREDLPAPPRGGKVTAFLLFIAIAGGVYFFSQTRRPAPPAAIPAGPGAESSPLSTSGAPPVDAPAPVAGAPRTAPPAALRPTTVTGSPSAPAAPSAGPAATVPETLVPESRGATMISPDWAGHPAAFMIHFSSYQKKENADRDAARLARVLGRPMHVIGVNLGPAGRWYRVMLGEFASREEADAYRTDLTAKGTAGMGLVYRVSASTSDGPSVSPSP
jgi:cell division protein FtsN